MHWQEIGVILLLSSQFPLFEKKGGKNQPIIVVAEIVDVIK